MFGDIGNMTNKTNLGKPNRVELVTFDCVSEKDCNSIELCKEDLCICDEWSCWR